ncbi:biogenesis of lysosome-related organelles complex 1 subunit 6-like [Diprion similis]|uniref:biogenesis of lysosome-related organelles complex 1 subunit 6-like n=1 Tax=Diprion similis TaxID=362088 RepID=UPI001EF91F58|nr:biogenesis of lysosome-related organelles complex 1 subunit 6-like [Diprion similis]
MMTDIGEQAAVEVQPKIEQCESPNGISIDFTQAAENLAQGLLEVYQPPLEQVKHELIELTNKQETLIAQMQGENAKLRQVDENLDINELFTTIKIYQAKLANIKKDMTSVHERTNKLKKRAIRFQQVKEKEVLLKEQQREQEIRREQELIGKPSGS